MYHVNKKVPKTISTYKKMEFGKAWGTGGGGACAVLLLLSLTARECCFFAAEAEGRANGSTDIAKLLLLVDDCALFSTINTFAIYDSFHFKK